MKKVLQISHLLRLKYPYTQSKHNYEAIKIK